MDLTGKQKRFLRSLGQKLDPVVRIGHEGLTEGLLAAVSDALDRHELIKVRLPGDLQPAERRAAAALLTEATDSVSPGAVGGTVLLYRPNDELPQPQRIHLPRGEM